jgi:hypothetical protein
MRPQRFSQAAPIRQHPPTPTPPHEGAGSRGNINREQSQEKLFRWEQRSAPSRDNVVSPWWRSTICAETMRPVVSSSLSIRIAAFVLAHVALFASALALGVMTG